MGSFISPQQFLQCLCPSIATPMLIVAIVTLAYLAWYHHPKYGKNPGPKLYPVLGCFPEIIWNMKTVHDWVTRMIEKSPNMTMRTSRPMSAEFWVTADPANVEHMLKTNFENYPKGRDVHEIMVDLLGSGIFNADGSMWKLQRQVANREFTTRSLRSFMAGSVTEELHGRLIPLLTKFCSTGVRIDLQDLFTRFTFDTICKLGFGVDPACLDPSLPTVKFARAFDAATSLTSERFFNYPFLWKTMRKLDVGPEKLLREAVVDIDAFAMYVIQSRRQQMQGRGLGVEKLDLLSRFMGLTPEDYPREVVAEGSSNKHHQIGRQVYSDVFLRDIVISFVLAGRDTSSSGLSWFFWLLSRNPHVEDSIYQELLTVLRSRGQPPPTLGAKQPTSLGFEELKQLHYLHAAITESMRLYPPVPIDIKQAAGADVWPDGTRIIPNAKVAYSAYAMGRMPSIWGDDCLEFRPQRWLSNGVFVPDSSYKFAAFHVSAFFLPRFLANRDESGHWSRQTFEAHVHAHCLSNTG